MITLLSIAIDIVALLYLGLLVLPLLKRGAPYVPTKNFRSKKIAELADIKPGEKSLDLGSGDGRIVIACAKKGAEAHGIEINPILASWSRYLINKEGLQKKAFIEVKDFWDEDLSKFSIVTVYGIAHIMERLEEKFERELPAGARVICSVFPLPNRKPCYTEDRLFVYVKI